MKLNYWKTLKVGLAFAIIMVFWTAYDYVVPLLLEHAYGLPNSVRGLVMGLDNLLSLFLLPIFGKISDKTRTKWGRRTPFIVIGTVISVILMIFVPISANQSLKDGEALRNEITTTWAEGYTYTDHEGNVYDAKALYTMIYEKGAEDSDYCDYAFLESEGVNGLEGYLNIALNPELNEDGAPGETYERIVETGINTYASEQVYQKVTLNNIDSLIIYMVILFFVLVAMATFRSPAVALMPDVTPKPLRSQANAMINLAGGAGGAIAFLIYTITLMINPTGYIAIFVAVACSMIILLGLFLWLVKEPKLVRECEELCAEYGISNDDDDENLPAAKDGESTLSAEEIQKHKRARFISFLLILGSIFMWFMGYNAVSSNLSIYLTKILGLSSGFGGIVSGISMGISAIAFIPVGILAVKIGRRKSIMLGFGLATLAFILIFFFAVQRTTAAVVLYTLFYLISGFGLIIANVNTFPMVVELADSGDTGKYTGFYYAATMSAQAITPFIAGLIMDHFGSKYLFLYSTICVALAIVLMVFVKHGDSKAPPKSKLEMLGADD